MQGEGNMGKLVKTGDTCRCQYGAVPLPLTASNPKVTSEGPPALNIMDTPKGVFGICNSPMNPAAVSAKAVGATAPCTPTFLPPMWLPGVPKVLLRGTPALDDSSCMTCALGGPNCITISATGAKVSIG